MVTFDGLTPAQRKWVCLVELLHPEVKDTITYQQIQEFHAEFMKLRKRGAQYKVGLALWLIGKNAIQRGVYFFPGRANKSAPKTTNKQDKSTLAEQYRKELIAYGIV